MLRSRSSVSVVSNVQVGLRPVLAVLAAVSTYLFSNAYTLRLRVRKSGC